MRAVPGRRSVRVVPGRRSVRVVPGRRSVRVVPGRRSMRGCLAAILLRRLTHPIEHRLNMRLHQTRKIQRRTNRDLRRSNLRITTRLLNHPLQLDLMEHRRTKRVVLEHIQRQRHRMETSTAHIHRTHMLKRLAFRILKTTARKILLKTLNSLHNNSISFRVKQQKPHPETGATRNSVDARDSNPTCMPSARQAPHLPAYAPAEAHKKF